MVTLLILINDGQAAHIIYMPERATKPVARPETNLLPPYQNKKKEEPQKTLTNFIQHLCVYRFHDLMNCLMGFR